MATYHVAHDPFARVALHRESTANSASHPRDCSWCGQTPRRLYRYATESDARGCPDMSWSARPFCNLACFRAYHG